MKTMTKLGAFLVALVLVFGSAYFVGGVLEPPTDDEAAAAPAPAASSGHDDGAPGGLTMSEESMTLKVLTDSVPAGKQQLFAFQILERDGKPLQVYKAQHDKLMHLIVARRDLAHFQHVHPNLGADGTWRVPLTFPAAGEYKIFADFFPGWGIHGTTLGADVSVSGNYQPRPLPSATNTATVDGYTVTLSGKLVPGKSTKLTVHVTKDGQPVTDLEPYLAAFGHLVVLRDGDLAYLHVHPEGTPGDGKTPPGPEVSFFAEPPSAGAYRLFLDFQHQGVVRTAEFTMNVEGPNPPPHGLTPEQFEQAKEINLSGGNSAEEGISGGGETGGAEGGTHGHGG